MSRLTRFAWLVLVTNIAVILWGVAVRATRSGDGCGSHWPLCNGEVVPQAPRVATVIEFSHRVSSGLALLLVVALAVLAFVDRRKGDPTRKAAVTGVLLMLSEAGVGAGLVLFRLVADNQSMARAMFMGTHLVNTFFLLAALTLTVHFSADPRRLAVRGQGWLGAGLGAGLLGLLLAGVSGAVAALGDTLFPAKTLSQALGQDLSATGHLLIRLRLLHPAIAVGAGVVAILLTLHPREGAARWARWTALLVVCQWGAGLLNVLLLAPVWMQMVHLLLADLVWIAFVRLAASSVVASSVLPATATPEPARPSRLPSTT